ncbi:hypothetical protein JA9_002327 [Meyerozyma sp. JA9]|nr:hypothetical protein JA9_002327 [Meyerozyma sp. JA9]
MCSGCDRNFLVCNWPNYRNQTLSQFRKSEVTASNNKVVLVNKDSGGGIDAQDKTRKYLTRQFLGTLIPEPSQYKAQEVLEHQLKTSLPLQLVVECVEALLVSNENTSQDLLYEETLNALREEFSNSSAKGSEDWGLNAINLLMIRELILPAPRISEILKHLQASLHILCTRITRDDVSFWLRLNADSFVFYSGMATICCSETEILMMPNPFESEKIFEPLFENAKPPHDLNSNPILGNAYEALILSNQTSYLLRSNTSQTINLATVLLRKINSLIRADANNLQLSIVYCTKIVLLKIIHHRISIKDGKIQEANEQLLRSLHNAKRSEVKLLGLWPTIVCAACSTSPTDTDLILEFCGQSDVDGIPDELNEKLKSSLKRIWSENMGLGVLDDLAFLKALILNP